MGTQTPGYPLTALWINNPTFDTDHRHQHRGSMLTKTPPPTELQIPATVTTLYFSARIVNIWNSLPNHVVDVNSDNLFTAHLDRFWMDQDVKYDFTADLTGTGDRPVNVISEM